MLRYEYPIVNIKERESMEEFQVLGKLYLGFDNVGVNGWDYRSPRDCVRTVFRNVSFTPVNVNKWHSDGTWRDRAVLLWASEYPTEVKLSNGDIVSGDSYDVVLIDNLRTKHRTPEEFVRRVLAGKMTNRYFRRAILRDFPSQVQIEDLKRNIRMLNAESRRANAQSW